MIVIERTWTLECITIESNVASFRGMSMRTSSWNVGNIDQQEGESQSISAPEQPAAEGFQEIDAALHCELNAINAKYTRAICILGYQMAQQTPRKKGNVANMPSCLQMFEIEHSARARSHFLTRFRYHPHTLTPFIYIPRLEAAMVQVGVWNHATRRELSDVRRGGRPGEMALDETTTSYI
jgi:hypothetical protein